jgi:epoxyqueuosine reductase
VSHCGKCRLCVTACPAAAPHGRNWTAGMAREEFFDAFRCREHARRLSAARGINATICGICIAVCPWIGGRKAESDSD